MASIVASKTYKLRPRWGRSAKSQMTSKVKALAKITRKRSPKVPGSSRVPILIIKATAGGWSK
jgi:hypothetical protein